MDDRRKRRRGDVNLCICEYQNVQGRRRVEDGLTQSGCRREEQKYGEDFFLRGMMVSLPKAEERSERYGGISRRERWLAVLGLREEDLAQVKQPVLRWTHFPLKCFNHDGAKRRRMLKIVNADSHTDPLDVIRTGEFSGKAIASPSVNLSFTSTSTSSSFPVVQTNMQVVEPSSEIEAKIKEIARDPRGAAIQIVALESKEVGLQEHIASLKNTVKREREEKEKLLAEIRQLMHLSAEKEKRINELTQALNKEREKTHTHTQQ